MSKKSEKELVCICGCSSREHTRMNNKAWDRLNKQIAEIEAPDTPENREKFWAKFLSDGGSTADEWACSTCSCGSFKMDNLKFLEDRYKEKEDA